MNALYTLIFGLNNSFMSKAFSMYCTVLNTTLSTQTKNQIFIKFIYVRSSRAGRRYMQWLKNSAATSDSRTASSLVRRRALAWPHWTESRATARSGLSSLTCHPRGWAPRPLLTNDPSRSLPLLCFSLITYEIHTSTSVNNSFHYGFDCQLTSIDSSSNWYPC